MVACQSDTSVVGVTMLFSLNHIPNLNKKEDSRAIFINKI